MSPIDEIYDFIGEYSEMGRVSMGQADWLAEGLERLCAHALTEHVSPEPDQDVTAEAVLRWALTIGIGVILPQTLAFIDASLGKAGVLEVLEEHPEWTTVANQFARSSHARYFVINRTLLADDGVFIALFQPRERIV